MVGSHWAVAGPHGARTGGAGAGAGAARASVRRAEESSLMDGGMSRAWLYLGSAACELFGLAGGRAGI